MEVNRRRARSNGGESSPYPRPGASGADRKSNNRTTSSSGAKGPPPCAVGPAPTPRPRTRHGVTCGWFKVGVRAGEWVELSEGGSQTDVHFLAVDLSSREKFNFIFLKSLLTSCKEV